MASYEIRWARSAERELRKLDPPVVPRVVDAVNELAADPRPRGCRKLQGAQAGYRIRVGEHRIIYHVDDGENRVTIAHVRHRDAAYR